MIVGITSSNKITSLVASYNKTATKYFSGYYFDDRTSDKLDKLQDLMTKAMKVFE